MELTKNFEHYSFSIKTWTRYHLFAFLDKLANKIASLVVWLRSKSPEMALSQKPSLGRYRYISHQMDIFPQLPNKVFSSNSEVTYYDTENSEFARHAKKKIPRGIDHFEENPSKEKSPKETESKEQPLHRPKEDLEETSP